MRSLTWSYSVWNLARATKMLSCMVHFVLFEVVNVYQAS